MNQWHVNVPEVETYPKVHNASCGQDNDLATLQVSKSHLLLLYLPSAATKITDLGRVAPLLYQLDINKARPGYMPAYDIVTERMIRRFLQIQRPTMQIPRRIRIAIICLHV